MKKLMNVLFVFIPLAFLAEFLHWGEATIFILSALAIIPVAGLMGEATEHLSEKTGPGVGALLNATFGNATELIIALFALQKGLHEIVRASITGSIIGNILFVFGASIIAGGMKHKEQKFGKQSNNIGVALLFLSSISLIMPTIFHMTVKNVSDSRQHTLSFAVAIVLFISYVCYMFFSLKTHKDLFRGEEGIEDVSKDVWSLKKSIGLLVLATVGVAFISEFLVGSVEHVAKQWGMSEVFIGVFLLAVLGNAAEHSTAVIVAMKDKMDLATQIAIGSSTQIALLVTPILVFTSNIFWQPMDLIFNPLEAIAIGLSVAIVTMVTYDVKTHWMEGVSLLGAYAIFGIMFYFHP